MTYAWQTRRRPIDFACTKRRLSTGCWSSYPTYTLLADDTYAIVLPSGIDRLPIKLFELKLLDALDRTIPRYIDLSFKRLDASLIQTRQWYGTQTEEVMIYARQTCRPIDFGTSAGYRLSHPTYTLLADVTYTIVLPIELFGRTGQNRAMNAEQSFLIKICMLASFRLAKLFGHIGQIRSKMH